MKFILSKEVALKKYNEVKELCDIVSYSSKTNPKVTPILEENTDSMFSVHTKNELKHIKDKSRVIFLAQAWRLEEIQELVNEGIRNFVVDNEVDLDVMERFLEDNKIPLTLYLRIKLKENTIRTEKYYVFGMDSDVVNQRIRELWGKAKLGIHFHRKTQNMAEWNLKYEMSSIIDEDVKEIIEFVNIGGGLPSEYANTNLNVMESIRNKVNEFREWLGDIKLVIEPGRFIAAPSVKLHTKILAIHGNTIIVDASVYNSDMDALIVPVKLKVEGEKEEGKSYSIKGSTPCSLDLFRYKVYLEPKDEIIFLNAGAYNFHSDFCDLNEIETEVVEKF
ncbi:decarboxylase [Candidatus Woesearchaeota archaeon]|nr:decarboxylase [Candidatus Woesearchaeota archaeon]